MLISICIPSYNRPEELLRLLKSIDAGQSRDIEIVICEDKSPRREEIGAVVQKFQKETAYLVRYFENKENLGFDKNLKELIRKAKGEWVLFIGDDDEFIPGALDKLSEFLKKHRELGYILRSYELIHKNGKLEKFRYYDRGRFFEPGYETYIALFRKSVFISGFTIKRKLALPYLVDEFDGTLLFQLYLMAEVVLKNRAAYFDEILVRQYEEGPPPLFGTAAAEKRLYRPGLADPKTSLNFLKGFLKITNYLDRKYAFNSTEAIRKDMSKYFYPALAIQRNRGLMVFLKYVAELNKLGFNITPHYYLYAFFLILFGKRICDEGIRIVKNILGRTPQL